MEHPANHAEDAVTAAPSFGGSDFQKYLGKTIGSIILRNITGHPSCLWSLILDSPTLASQFRLGYQRNSGRRQRMDV